MTEERFKFDNLLKYAGLGLVEAFVITVLVWMASSFGFTGSAWAVTCACKCKNEAGKNVVLAPDYMEPRPATVRRPIRKVNKKSPVKPTETFTENEPPVEYERVTDDASVVEEKPREDEIQDGIQYQAGHELMISPAPEVKEPGYPIEGTPAPEVLPSPMSPPPTAPLPN